MTPAKNLALAALLALAPACSSEAVSKTRPPPPARSKDPATAEAPMLQQRGKVTLKTRAGVELQLDVEIASSDPDRARGLMFRRTMPEMAGMMFVFPETEVHSFWMRNTLLPLDMMFVAADGTIVGIVENAEPQTLTQRAVAAPSKYVLEVNGGFSARHGIAPGDTATLQGMYELR